MCDKPDWAKQKVQELIGNCVFAVGLSRADLEAGLRQSAADATAKEREDIADMLCGVDELPALSSDEYQQGYCQAFADVATAMKQWAAMRAKQDSAIRSGKP